MKFSIIILHYQTVEDTNECIRSIQKYQEFKKGSIDIVIVDNGSPNKSGNFLKKEYSESRNIHVILLDKNLGFACGNNIGFKYVKEKLDSDILILCNSDITITQSDFFSRIEEIYRVTGFTLLGPDIRKPVNKKVDHQNPKMMNAIINESFLEQEIVKLRYMTNKSIILSYLAKIPPFGFLKKTLQEKRIRTYAPASEIDNTIMLYGAFLIFSKNYIEIFPEGLFDRTFMYGEEYALAYRVQKYNLCQVYSKDIFVNHFEGKSTLSEKNNIERTKFLRDEGTKSLVEIRKYIIDSKGMS